MHSLGMPLLEQHSINKEINLSKSIQIWPFPLIKDYQCDFWARVQRLRLVTWAFSSPRHNRSWQCSHNHQSYLDPHYAKLEWQPKFLVSVLKKINLELKRLLAVHHWTNANTLRCGNTRELLNLLISIFSLRKRILGFGKPENSHSNMTMLNFCAILVSLYSVIVGATENINWKPTLSEEQQGQMEIIRMNYTRTYNEHSLHGNSVQDVCFLHSPPGIQWLRDCAQHNLSNSEWYGLFRFLSWHHWCRWSCSEWGSQLTRNGSWPSILRLLGMDAQTADLSPKVTRDQSRRAPSLTVGSPAQWKCAPAQQSHTECYGLGSGWRSRLYCCSIWSTNCSDHCSEFSLSGRKSIWGVANDQLEIDWHKLADSIWLMCLTSYVYVTSGEE